MGREAAQNLEIKVVSGSQIRLIVAPQARKILKVFLVRVISGTYGGGLLRNLEMGTS